MKAYVKRPLLAIVLAALSLLLILFFIQNTNKKSVSQNKMVSKASLRSVRLKIPALNVNANIQYVGVTKEGTMDVPSNTVDVGWFDLGTRPGEQGSAVIAGHLDGKNGEAGVFSNLNKLKKGDKVYVEDNKGKSITFVVSKIRIYDPGYANEVFSRNDGIYLNLVTCDGAWDNYQKNYTKRLVVFTDIIK